MTYTNHNMFISSARPPTSPKRLPRARPRRTPRPRSVPSPHTCSSPKTGENGSRLRTLMLVSVSVQLCMLGVHVPIGYDAMTCIPLCASLSGGGRIRLWFSFRPGCPRIVSIHTNPSSHAYLPNDGLTSPPPSPTGEIGKLLGAKWKELDDSEKKVSHPSSHLTVTTKVVLTDVFVRPVALHRTSRTG